MHLQRLLKIKHINNWVSKIPCSYNQNSSLFKQLCRFSLQKRLYILNEIVWVLFLLWNPILSLSHLITSFWQILSMLIIRVKYKKKKPAFLARQSSKWNYRTDAAVLSWYFALNESLAHSAWLLRKDNI